MRPQKVDDQKVMTGLMTVLRAKGFDGASMNDLAEATGLKKASLYHRFPGGKKEITDAVLKFVADWSINNIQSVLTDQKTAPQKRLATAIKNIRSLYDNGDSICVLRALTTEGSIPLFGLQIADGFKIWVKAFTQLGVDLGLSKSVARKKAQEVLIRVQGSLVLSKGLGELTPFQQSLSDIKQMYNK